MLLWASTVISAVSSLIGRLVSDMEKSRNRASLNLRHASMQSNKQGILPEYSSVSLFGEKTSIFFVCE